MSNVFKKGTYTFNGQVVQYSELRKNHLEKRVNELSCEIDIAKRSGKRDPNFIKILEDQRLSVSQELDIYKVQEQKNVMNYGRI